MTDKLEGLLCKPKAVPDSLHDFDACLFAFPPQSEDSCQDDYVRSLCGVPGHAADCGRLVPGCHRNELLVVQWSGDDSGVVEVLHGRRRRQEVEVFTQ